MMTIKKEKLIKKVIGIMVFIMAMITIITNVNTQKIYAYEISPEVNGTVDVQYTLDYEFEEHCKLDLMAGIVLIYDGNGATSGWDNIMY